MSSQVSIELRVFGDGVLQHHVKNELNVDVGLKYIKGKEPGGQEDYWSYKTGCQDVFDVNDQVKGLLIYFSDKKDHLRRLLVEFDLEVAVDIVIRMKGNETPALYFEKEFIEFLHYLSAEVDVDMYID